MAIATPAKLAILGAGPLGLEAALYARFLGYAVVIFAADFVASVGFLEAGAFSPIAIAAGFAFTSRIWNPWKAMPS